MPQAVPAIIIAAGQVAAEVAVWQIVTTFVVNVGLSGFEFRDAHGERLVALTKQE